MGTHYKGTPAEVTALDTFIKLMRAADSVSDRSHAILPKGLTMAQFGVLEILLHRGPICPSELAAKLLKSAGNLTLVIDNLERDGHVRRERSTEDRRFITIHLTDQGLSFITELFPKIADAITREFSILSAAEQAILGELLRKLGRGATTAPTQT